MVVTLKFSCQHKGIETLKVYIVYTNHLPEKKEDGYKIKLSNTRIHHFYHVKKKEHML